MQVKRNLDQEQLAALRVKYTRIAVLAGGDSSERAVSLESGHGVLSALQDMGFSAFLFDPANRDIEELLAERPSISMIMLHGGSGEDGRMQAWHQLHGIPFTGADFAACALAMNKHWSKLVWQEQGLRVIPGVCVYKNSTVAQLEKKVAHLQYPVIVKPNTGGSSIGLHVIDSGVSLRRLWQTERMVMQCDMLVEQYIQGKEYTVGMLASELLPPICIETASGIYDYQAKYEANDTLFVFDTLLPTQKAKLLKMTRTALFCLQVSSWGRVDFLCDNTGQFYLLEANLVPGMTSHSLIPAAARELGYSYQAVIGKLLACANTT